VTFEPVAVVGRACVLPGALHPAALWQQVLAGADLLGTAPPTRWRLDRARLLGLPPGAADGAASDRGGYVAGFEELFDPSGLRLAEGDAAALDPLVRWLLHVTREALRDAGLAGGPRAGAVFGNLSFPSASLARFAEGVWLGEPLARRAGVPPADPRNRFMSGLPAHLVAAALDLGAGAFCIDAACASSLYAVKLACDRLRDRTADLMVAGAVNCADDLFIHVGFTALRAMSPSGCSRPFHRGADGLVPAEGAGAVVLKRLRDAEADGDRILGVIRAVGLSNDGRAGGLLAPAEGGQVRAMRAAYAAAGLRPADVSLVECHATGTLVGDAVEVRSMRRVFDGVRDLPIGSLKSNLGHAIAAAGVAGLLKVLGALEAGVRPPTRGADDPIAELDGSPFRLLREPEAWACSGPRRAAVSAFGFGGNNAHLIVEEHRGGRSAALSRSAAPGRVTNPVPACAVVGLGAAVGDGSDAAAFEAALFAARPGRHRRAGALGIAASALRFPPRDLEAALPQQLWVMAAAGEALAGRELPDRSRVGVFVGMGCDPEVARYGARWRVADWAAAWGVDEPGWAARAAAAFAPPLEAAGVVGTMPNIPANRLNAQHDFGGPGFTVAAEELSGVRALEVAVRALRAGEIDLALVAAADFSCEPVHEAALRGVGIAREPGDGAVVLLVKRAGDARRDGDTVLALLDEEPADALELDGAAVEERFGCAHAASGLVRVAAAVLACARGRHVGGAPWTGSRAVRVAIDALGGQRAVVRLRSDGEAVVPAAPGRAPAAGAVREYRAHAARPVLPGLPADAEPVVQVMAPAPALAPVLDRDDALGAPVGRGGAGFAPPPSAPDPVRRAPVEAAVRGRVGELAAPAAHGIPGAHAGGAPSPRTGRAPAPRREEILAQAAADHARLAEAHRRFLETQVEMHRRFLAVREAAAQGLLAAGRGAGPPLDTPAAAFPGPALDRRGLEAHASGRISGVFGELFRRQDGYPRQVRMPEPPLLLADRLLGIDAVAGSMGTGTLWTETDVREDAWYLHEGRMPAGVMIEAGQADLLLISYLGVDFLNRGERVYRLLGCDLRFLGEPPRPGDTLRYAISVDGHTMQGAVRLFSFHYDCTVRGEPRLQVRGGQAGFFTEAELADSMGVLWDPAGAAPAAGRCDPPAVRCERTAFARAELEAFAAGRIRECFGKGFEAAAAHTSTPRIAGGRMLFLDEVDTFAPGGGPWGRGYLRAVDRIEPDDWFFQGHFKNDPCMPGTLMFEGCLQAMALYLAALGHTLERDGWRFEPVPEETYRLRCRGQVTPRSRELVYEVFVEEVWDGPTPTLWADLLCTVDGLKAFHCRRMGLRLVPGWPLESRPALAAGLEDRLPVAAADGFRFGAASLLACAWGRPSAAFGPVYRLFDGPRRLPRLPGPPYHFMSRVVATEGAMGGMAVGSAVEVEYDVPADAWYFRENGAPTMPFCVLLEVALQPCGWLALFVGSALAGDRDLSFRNLDGTGTVLAEVPPGAGTIRTRTVLQSVSSSGGMIIESFLVTCSVGGLPVYELKTVFGFFPAEALAAQKGLPATEAERAVLAAPSAACVDLRTFAQEAPGPRLAALRLLMIDRVTGIWPQGGPAGLGRYRAETAIDPDAWFFKAHFFQDPVQPGSLGLESMVQLLQFAMLHGGLAKGREQGRFEPVALGAPLQWKYRGQVLLRNAVVHTLLDVVRTEEEEGGGVLAVADASLWVDGMRIYEATGLAMRIVCDGGAAPAARAAATPEADDEVLDPATAGWVRDHRPTWTVPALPLMAMVERMAAAAARRAPGRHVVAVEDARVRRWLPLDAPVRLRVRAEEDGDGVFAVSLLAWRAASSSALSRYEPVASARVRVAAAWPAAEQAAWDPPADAHPAPDPYAAGALFHGPAFRLVTSLARGAGGSTALLDAAAGGVFPVAFLDALTHGIPHDELAAWSPEVPGDRVAYPHRVVSLRFHGPVPAAGTVRLETRFTGFDGDVRHPRFAVQAIAAGRVVASLDLVEVLLPKGPIGSLPREARRAFLRDRVFVAGARIAREEGGATRCTVADVRASDWLPGTVAAAYGGGGDDLVAAVAVGDHVAARAGVHPATVSWERETGVARAAAEPLTARPLALAREGDAVVVRDAGPARLDLAPVRAFWDAYFGIGRWPVEDLYYGLAERFVDRVRLADPEAFGRLRGRPVLYLANHQVGVESLLFSVLASGISGVRTVTLAKIEHRTTWLGLLIQHAFSHPGVVDPGVITYFDRAAREELPRVIAFLADEIRLRGKSVMVHVEGTRSFSCRTPVVKMSGAFLDMAIATATPVVPVRFSGGLPAETLPEHLEFPTGMGRQVVWIGRPLEPAELAALPYKERKDLVVGAINGLGPSNAEETPGASDPEFAAAAAAWSRATGASPEHAVLHETLRRVDHPCDGTRLLLDAVRARRLPAADGTSGPWLAELAKRLGGRAGTAPPS
jgi:acyl transferase domain-containing protein/1-acyl-sn-glycerol-3-phosphate acyltransferase